MKPIASRIAALGGEGALSVFARAKALERAGRSIVAGVARPVRRFLSCRCASSHAPSPPG